MKKNLKKWLSLTGITISMLMLSACQPEAGKLDTVKNEDVSDGADSADVPDKNHVDSADVPDKTGGEDVTGSAKLPQDSQQEGGVLYDGADLEGSVVKFTEESCFISPSKTEKAGEGEILESAAPGSEDLSQLVEITYGDNCQFQIITLDREAQKEVSREDTVREEIKKGTDILVFGSSQDAEHWTAERVAIMRWQ